MNKSEQERIAKLLKKSLPPVGEGKSALDGIEKDNAQLGRDLWPAMLQRLQQPTAPGAWFERAWFERVWFNQAWFNQAWFDGALLAAVVAWLAFFPAAIPVLLYHL